MKKPNNAGYTMIMTLVAVTLIIVLGTLILSVSSMNLRMKYADKKSKMDFYTAESALDEISSGLGLFVSEQFGYTYTDILRKSSNGSVSKYKTQEEAYDAFRIAFYEALDMKFIGTVVVPPLTEKAQDSTKAVLESYTTINETTPNAVTVNPSTEESKKIVIEKECDASGIPVKYILKNVTVRYRDGKGYESTVTSDIVIEIPYVDFFDEHDNLLDYALIGNKGVYFEGSAIEVKGNVYAGSCEAADAGKAEYAEKGVYGGVNVYNADVKIAGKYIVTPGNITVRDGASLTMNGVTGETDECNVWAESIRTAEYGTSHATNDAKLKISGNTFLSNDLELNSYQSKVELKGAFYGYNNKTYDTGEYKAVYSNDGIDNEPSHTKSSAIIVNGKKCALDMSQIDTLVVAGKAYIDLAAKAGGNTALEYATGESLALKTNQFIYLAPSEYLLCYNPSIETAFAAGMNKDQIEAAASNIPASGWFAVDKGWLNMMNPLKAEAVSYGGKTYYYFYLNLVTPDNVDHTVEFTKFVLQSQEGSGDVYESQAYQLKEKMKERVFQDMLTDISVKEGADCRIYGQGALQKTVGSGTAGDLKAVENSAIGTQYKEALSLDVIAQASTKLNRRYEALYSLLEPNEMIPLSGVVPEIKEEDYLSKTHKNADGSLYQANDIKHGKYLPLSNYVDCFQVDSNSLAVNTAVPIESDKAVMKDGDLTIDSNYSGIIICDGTVTIKSGAVVKGIVLATGKIYVKEGAKVLSDRGVVQGILDKELKLTGLTPEQKKQLASYYMVNYSPSEQSTMNSYNTSNNYMDWISYKNWKKGE